MRGVLLLARGGLTARPVRTLLLTMAVALSSALVAAVACAMGSVNASVRHQLEQSLGTAEARVRPIARGGLIDPSVVAVVAGWPEVQRATARSNTACSVTFDTTLFAIEDGTPTPRTTALRAQTMLEGGGPATFERVPLLEGRMPTAPSEVVIDALLAERLSGAYATQPASDRRAFALSGADVAYLGFPAPDTPTAPTAEEAEAYHARVGPRPGDRLKVVKLFGPGPELRIVGVAEAPPLGGRPRAFALLETVDAVRGRGAGLTEIELELREGVDAEAFIEARAADVGTRLLLQSTERLTTGVERNLASNRVGFVLASVLAFLAASFIILTGLTTGLAEQQRALAMVRAIGGARKQLAAAQLLTGTGVGVLGGLLGTPLGVGLAYTLTLVFPDRFPAGMVVPPVTLSVASIGALCAGVMGGTWPAIQAARLSPLEALATRARPVRTSAVIKTAAGAVFCLGVMTTTVAGPDDGNVAFWGYATVGAPMLMTGWFLACVPLLVVLAAATSPLIGRVLRLPPGLLGRTLRATPFRHGFTAGAMMVGLALLVSLWTNGGAFMRDWVGRIRFPDAFVSGLRLPAEVQELTESVPGVRATSAISIQDVKVDTFGIEGLSTYSTKFVAFEPGPFFDIVAVEWVEGDLDSATPALDEGGSIIIAEEFRVARGLGMGDSLTCVGPDGEPHEFEIAGVVRAPGLAMVSVYFDFGESVTQQSLHYVFGSRRDMVELFGNDTIEVLAVDIDDDVPDEVAIPAIWDATAGAGVLNVGSGRTIKAELIDFVASTLVVFSAVAIGSMLIACFGVANLVVAGIEARRFEFGVLRAIGSSRGLIVRLIIGELLVVALTACIAGTAMGLHGAWAGQMLNRVLIGLDMRVVPPIGPIVVGWVFVVTLTLAAGTPAVVRLSRRKPRELLSAR